MDSDQKPQGGVRLDMAFGERRDSAPLARSDAALTFRLAIVGDFGGEGTGRPRDISGEDIADLLASFGAVASLEVPNRLASAPPALALRLPLASVRDLDPRTIASRLPTVAEDAPLASAAAQQPAGTPDGPTTRPDTAGEQDDGAIDRLLGMIDAPQTPTTPQAAVSALLSSIARPRSAPAPATPAASPRLQAQMREVVTHPSWLALEAAWRSLRLIVTARGSRAATRLSLYDVPRDGIADLLNGEEFGHVTADVDLTAILVVGAFGRSARDLDALDRVAEAAARIGVPVIVSLAQDFLGAPPETVVGMDNPRALLEGPGYGAWRGLRGRDESRLLFATWNDVVLRPAAGEAPILWGEPGVILAAQILRSLARLDWPTDLAGAASALGGLDVAEIAVRGGSAAIPLRAAAGPGTARELADAGILSLVCRADRDAAWFTHARPVHGPEAMAEADRKAMETFVSLPFLFVSSYLDVLLRRNGETFARGLSGAEAADAIARLLKDVLRTTGPGAAARVEPTGNGGFEATIRLGDAVMDGFTFAFDIDV